MRQRVSVFRCVYEMMTKALRKLKNTLNKDISFKKVKEIYVELKNLYKKYQNERLDRNLSEL